MTIFSHYRERYASTQKEELSIQEYLELCKSDPSVYASAPERMLLAIGEPELVDTARDPRLSRIFSNKIIKRYKAFEDFYGMDEAIEQIVSFFKHAAQGLEEKKQILYLLGPVGGGKSSLAEKLKALMEKQPIYCLK
ncbi:MAG TPA: PrkA family serine protein kinase, partial [Cellvibrionaceae bacterium]|nr:PrkA family serine protein kinase [Cellvibrionaceae bacterium]